LAEFDQWYDSKIKGCNLLNLAYERVVK
jgi:hypothetical protein